MGLGGIARDSIVGLNKIVQDDDTDDLPHSSRRHSDNGMLWTSGSNDSNAGEGNNKLLGFDVEGTGDGDDHEDVDSFPGRGLSRVASFHIPLTDGLASVGGTVATTTPSLSPSSINLGTTSTTPISSSSSSKNNGIKSPSWKGNSAAVQQVSSRYQGFHYEGYADYYSDDFASYSFDEYSHSNSTDGSNASQQHQESKKNIFCCLFAPWMQHKVIIEDIEKDNLPALISSVQGDEKVGGTIESTTTSSSDMVLESPTLTPTPSFDEKISSPSASAAASSSLDLGCEAAPSNETLDLPNLQSNARTPKTTKNFVPTNDLDELEPTASCFMPLDVGSSSLSISTGVDSSSSLPSSSHEGNHHPMDEEKKQEECDHEVARTTTPRDAPKDVVAVEDGQDKNEVPPPRPIKGILKVWCSTNSLPKTMETGRKSVSTPMSPNKRQLFPTYEQKKKPNSPGDDEAKSIKFNPMARVLTIPSRNDFPLQQKAQVWWQKYDYDEFKKTGRIISKAMECGGSEIWLASSNAWGDKSARSSPRERVTINGKHSEEYTKALSKYVNEPKKGSDDEGDNDDNSGASSSNFGNKWWCKFGHSRRGLEHVVSSSEGKARQQSVLLAIRMVMEEQKRQRASRTKDPNKLRSVAMQYTSWAKDLALAAAAADAEAVSSNFDPSAKCRAQHFAKRLNVNSSTLHTLHNSDIVGGGVAMAITSQILDANTHRTPIATTNTKKLVEQSLQAANTVEHNLTKDISLSKRAKGFMPGAVEDVSAAALLSGMGNMGFRSVKA